MWWNHYSWSGEYWPMPWMFFGPVMMIIFFLACAAVAFFMLRGAMFHRGHAGAAGMMSCCETGLGPSLERATGQDTKNSLRTKGSPAFDEYRAETLRRLELEQDEFQEFVDHLRMAKDKAEFDQFIAERRGSPPLA
jgi:Protein of unknown function (DUF2852).